MNREPNLAAGVCSETAVMNGQDTMPVCARIAAIDPAMADRMWNTASGQGGRDLIDERMSGKGRMLCSACPMYLGCISRALVGGWKDKTVYDGLEYASRWSLARLIARDLHVDAAGLHRIPQSRVRDWLAEHPDWAERMRRNGRDCWRRTKSHQRSRREYTHDEPLFLKTEPCPRAWSRVASSRSSAIRRRPAMGHGGYRQPEYLITENRNTGTGKYLIPTYRNKEKPINDKNNREPMVIALTTGEDGNMKTTSAVFLACALVDRS